MVAINTSPVLRGGDYITEYEAGATTTLTDYVFPSVQETVFVRNDGVRDISIIASGQTYKIPPNQSVRITDNVTTVQIKSEAGTQPFKIEGRTGTATGGASSEIQRINEQLIERVQGETGKNLKIVACVLRNDGSGWKAITENNHGVVNVASVSNDTTNIYVDFAFTAKTTISFVACPDETMAVDKMLMGASVTYTQAKIQLNRLSQEAYIAYSGTSWTVPTGWSASFSAGTLTLTHPPTWGGATATARSGPYVAQLDSTQATQTKLVFRDFAGTLITTPDTNMRVFVTRFGGNAIDPNTYVNAGGNIWCMGIFGV